MLLPHGCYTQENKTFSSWKISMLNVTLLLWSNPQQHYRRSIGKDGYFSFGWTRQNIFWQSFHIVESKQKRENSSLEKLEYGPVCPSQPSPGFRRFPLTEPPTSFSLALLLQCHCPSLKFLQLQLQLPLHHLLLNPPLQHHEVHSTAGIAMRLFPQCRFSMLVEGTVMFMLHS